MAPVGGTVVKRAIGKSAGAGISIRRRELLAAGAALTAITALSRHAVAQSERGQSSSAQSYGTLPEVKPLRLIGPTLAPYYSEGPDGKVEGHLVALFDRIAKQAGIPWTGSLAPAARMFRMLADGEADTSILVAHEMLSTGGVLKSDKAISVMVLNAYRQAALPAVTAKEQLSGMTVAVLRGYSYGGMRAWMNDPANRVEIREVNTEETMLRFLEARRAEIGLLYDVNYETAVKRNGVEPKGLAVSNLARVPLYLHVHSRTVPDAPRVMERMMAAYEALVAAGELKGPDAKPEIIDKPIAPATDADKPRSGLLLPSPNAAPAA